MRGSHRGGDPHDTLPPLLTCGHRFRARGHSKQHLVSHGQQVLTDGRRAHAAGMSLEEFDIQQPLQVRNRLGDRRLRHPERMRRPLKAPQLCDLEQNLGVPELSAREQPVQEDGSRVRQGIAKCNR